jgi:hypothetical protein
MSGGVLIAGLGVVGLLLIMLFFKLGEREDNKHFLLQLIFLGFIVFVMILIGKTTIDYNDNCSWLVTNSTTSGSLTSYQYSYQCSTNNNNTASSFYDVTVWIFRIVIIYLFLYYAIEAFNYLAFRKKGGEE